jgi:hypothetical protein
VTAVAVSVTRTELSLTALDLTTAPFEVREEGLDVGATIWRREYERSPYIHGAQLVSAVKDITEGCTLAVDVTGASQAAIATNLGTLLAAFSQWSYTLQVSLDGTAYAWACSPADWTVGFVSNDLVFGLVCPVRLSFARQPVPVSGPA